MISVTTTFVMTFVYIIRRAVLNACLMLDFLQWLLRLLPTLSIKLLYVESSASSTYGFSPHHTFVPSFCPFSTLLGLRVLISIRSAHLLTLDLLLSFSLGIDTCSEWVLVSQSNLVHQEYQSCQHHSSWLSEPQCRAQEAESRAIVHWC